MPPSRPVCSDLEVSQPFLAADGTQLAVRQFSKSTSSLSCTPWHLPVHILTRVKHIDNQNAFKNFSRESTITTFLISDGTTVTWEQLVSSHPVFQLLQYRAHPLSLTPYFEHYGFILGSSISKLPWKEVITANWWSDWMMQWTWDISLSGWLVSQCFRYQFLHSLISSVLHTLHVA